MKSYSRNLLVEASREDGINSAQDMYGHYRRMLEMRLEGTPRNAEEAWLAMEKLFGLEPSYVKAMKILADRRGIMCSVFATLVAVCFACNPGVVIPRTMESHPDAVTLVSSGFAGYSLIFLLSCIACANFQATSKTLWWFIAYDSEWLHQRKGKGCSQQSRFLLSTFFTIGGLLACSYKDLSLGKPMRTCLVVITLIFISGPLFFATMFSQYIELFHNLATSPGQDMVYMFQKVGEPPFELSGPENAASDKIAPDFWRLSWQAFHQIEANVRQLYVDVSLIMFCQGTSMVGGFVLGLAFIKGGLHISGTILCVSTFFPFLFFLWNATRVSTLYGPGATHRVPPTVQSALWQILGNEPPSHTPDLFRFATYLRDSNVGAHVFGFLIDSKMIIKAAAAGSLLTYAAGVLVRKMGLNADNDNIEIVLNGTSYTCSSL